jgi:diacylglycerol kinase family enzyme
VAATRVGRGGPVGAGCHDDGTVATLSGDIPVAALALVLTLAANAAIWFALTERKLKRWVGAIASGLCLGGLVAVLIANWHGLFVLLALLLLLAAFGLAARYALGAPAPASHLSAPRAASPIGAGSSVVLIINPKSGGGKAEHFDLVHQAQLRGIEPIVLQQHDDLLELAERAVGRGAQIIGMAGGDGSQALVATVAARHDVAHVCIPAGTRNHFALDLGLDRDDGVGALDAYSDGVERRIDLATVNDRVFVNNASLGVYANVVQSDAYRDAKLETWTRLLPDLLGPDAEPIDLEFLTGDGTECADAALVLVSNNPYELAHLAGAGTRARIDTGMLGVVAARVRGTEVARLVALELVGQAHRFPGLLSWTGPEFEVRSGGPVAVGLDGEAILMDPPLRFRSLPGALRVRLPHSAGLAPAATAVPLSSASLGALFEIATGH